MAWLDAHRTVLSSAELWGAAAKVWTLCLLEPPFIHIITIAPAKASFSLFSAP